MTRAPDGANLPSLVVRRAGAPDAGAVAALHAQLVANPALQVLPARLDELRDRADAAVLIASADVAIVGTVFGAWCPDAMVGRRPFAVVENIVVAAHAGDRKRAFVKYRSAFASAD